MMKKIILIISLLLTICLTFSACDFDIVSVDNLMRPPKLSGESRYLQAAFEKTVGESETVIMKNPITGNNRSSYLLYDIDGNGVDEALVFYSDYSVDEYAYFCLFKQANDEWVPVADIKGRADEIYEVDFSDINGDGVYEILVSWTTFSSTNSYVFDNFSNNKRYLTVYSYNGSNAALIFSDFFSEMLVEDFNGDGSEEIFTVNIDLSKSKERSMGRIISFDSGYAVVHDTSFIMTSFINVFNLITDTVDKDGEKHTRIYVDGGISESGIVTEVVDVLHSDFEITLPLYESNTSENLLTLRDTRIFSNDIDCDGVVEIPTTVPLTGGVIIRGDGEERGQLRMTLWSEIDKNILVDDIKCVYNANYSYIFKFPDEWINKIAPVYNVKNATLTFYVLDDNLTIGDEIFSVRAFSRLQWDENSFGYSRFNESEAFVYGYKVADWRGFERKDIEENFIVID